METTAAPPVVAVVVTRDPGPWFDATLQALGAQDYPDLSVLVLDAGSAEDPTPRVAALLPGAYVRRLGADRGFAAAANEVLGMVEGASHLLLCHDDVAPDPDAVHLMVEESFRSNAGIVAPKIVDFDDPERLLHVGMGVDKGGAVVDRIEPGEVDHGQHDGVLDVFLAPGGCTLVRADLFAELGGFDPAVVVMGEDLDLCWRAQVAGARVIVAPAARVRHRELLASGRRDLTGIEAIDGRPPRHDADSVEDRLGELQALQRRHELRAVLKCYGGFHLCRVVPQLVFLSGAEWITAVVAGNRRRASAVVHAWGWNLRSRKELRARRAEVRAHRRLSDTEVRRLQMHGSARLSAFASRAVTLGMHAAHQGGAGDAALIDSTGAVATGGIAGIADADGEDGVSGVGPGRARPLRPGARPGGGGSVPTAVPPGRTRWVVAAWVAAVVVLLFGTRQLLGGGSLPVIGQFVPFPGVGTLFGRFLAGWQPTGVGLTAAATPGLAVLGVAGSILFGAVGLLQKVVVLGCIPLGGWGLFRLAAPLRSSRARLAATLVYLAVPLPYNALATGHWDGLLAYALAPWAVSSLAAASGLAPWSGEAPSAARSPGLVVRALALGLAVAVGGALAAPLVVLVLVIAVGLALGIVVSGGPGRGMAARRVLLVGGGSALVAAILLWPFTGTLFRGPGRWVALTGPAAVPAASPSWGHLLGLAVGPIGDTPLAWAFLVAAGLPLVIGGGWRLAWAVRAWVVALVAWLLVWVAGLGHTGAFAFPPQTVLPAAAVGVALAVGLGVVAFESDLPGYRFGWRQGASALAAVAAVLGAMPVVAAAGGGRWQMPVSGVGEATAWMQAVHRRGDFRVLWLGDQSVLPGTGWQLEPGLSFELTDDGIPQIPDLWPGGSPGEAATIARDVDLARSGDTVRLGHLLAPYAVRYVVVVDQLAPAVAGVQNPPVSPPPPGLTAGLDAQADLRQVLTQGGLDVYGNDDALPGRAARPGTPTRPGAPLPLTGWTPVLPGPAGHTSYTGPVPAGTVVAALAPAGDWTLTTGATSPRRGTAFGYAPRFEVSAPGRATLSYRGSWAHGLALLVQLVLWLAALTVVLGGWRSLRRRVARHRRVRAAPGEPGEQHHGDAGADRVDAPAPPGEASPAEPHRVGT